MGLGYTWVLVGIAAVRELLGNGTLLGFQVFPAAYQPIIFFVLPPGGFFVFALFISLNLFIKSRLKEPSVSTAKAGCEECPGCANCGIPENKEGQS
jgi:electron transport complex protein RnfE